MKKSFIIIGLGRFGASITKTLIEANVDVLAVDINEEAVEAISKVCTHCAIADTTKYDSLLDLGCSNINNAVVAIGNNLQASILTVVNLKKIGVKNIIVRSDELSHNEVYASLGATEIIIPEEASAQSLANQILSDTIIDFHIIYGDYVMVKAIVGDDFEPKSLIELDVRNRFNINIVGMIKDDKFFIPKGTDMIEPQVILVIAGTKKDINKFDNFLNK